MKIKKMGKIRNFSRFNYWLLIFAFEDANVSSLYRIFHDNADELIDFSITPEEIK